MKKYSQEHFSDLSGQKNVMILVGNGFDIKILSKVFGKKVTTSYSKFFDYLQYAGCGKENLIFSRMKEDKKKYEESGGVLCQNWSDFEVSLYDLATCENIETLREHLFEIQTYFSMFLAEIVTPEVLKTLGEKASKNEWAVNTMRKFLGDLDEESFGKLRFVDERHYLLYNFLFINFNYTSLLDNYIWLDKKQFDPMPNSSVDRNFVFYSNPKGYKNCKGIKKNWRPSSYILTDIIHPHGLQAIPKSILFGYDPETFDSHKRVEKEFVKVFWARNELKYRECFEGTELFIIYGASIGKTDRWWWKGIFDLLLKDVAELIIYNYSTTMLDSVEETKNKFIDACFEKEETRNAVSVEEIKKVYSNIYVVNFNDDHDTLLFNMQEKGEDKTN